MYVDDATIFINLVKEDVEAIKTILEAYGNVSGLHINMHKSSIHSIRCEETNLDWVLSQFTGTRGTFPCKYLGL
jgi:hypothetical protein